jgi:hypothetical protein
MNRASTRHIMFWLLTPLLFTLSCATVLGPLNEWLGGQAPGDKYYGPLSLDLVVEKNLELDCDSTTWCRYGAEATLEYSTPRTGAINCVIRGNEDAYGQPVVVNEGSGFVTISVRDPNLAKVRDDDIMPFFQCSLGVVDDAGNDVTLWVWNEQRHAETVLKVPYGN